MHLRRSAEPAPHGGRALVRWGRRPVSECCQSGTCRRHSVVCRRCIACPASEVAHRDRRPGSAHSAGTLETKRGYRQQHGCSCQAWWCLAPAHSREAQELTLQLCLGISATRTGQAFRAARAHSSRYVTHKCLCVGAPSAGFGCRSACMLIEISRVHNLAHRRVAQGADPCRWP